MKNYLSYYQEETGFDLEELERLEKELMDPDMFMIGNVPERIGGYSERKPQIACMMTKQERKKTGYSLGISQIFPL